MINLQKQYDPHILNVAEGDYSIVYFYEYRDILGVPYEYHVECISDFPALRFDHLFNEYEPALADFVSQIII